LFDAMSEEDQKLLQDAAKEANEYQIEETRKLEEKQMKELKEKGMEIYELNDKEKEAFKEALEQVYDKYKSEWDEDVIKMLRNKRMKQKKKMKMKKKKQVN